MSTVQMQEKDGRIFLKAPYNERMPSLAKEIGGRFDGNTKSWHFDLRDEQRARDLAIRIFGTDGTTGAADLVTIRIDCSSHEEYRRIMIAGVPVVDKRLRDFLPSLGPNTVLVSGDFSFSNNGSNRYPCIGTNDAVIEVRDVPKSTVQRCYESKPRSRLA